MALSPPRLKAKPFVDYSLYLVTDSNKGLLGERSLCDIVEASLKGGVTVVQYRRKTGDTGELVEEARRLHEVTKQYGVPLLINDRVDVALAVGCEGVHIGQTDMDLTTARRVLGPEAIIGVTVTTPAEAAAATSLPPSRGGADYVGIGTVFATPTKPTADLARIIGVEGVARVLACLPRSAQAAPQPLLHDVARAVCIGGIDGANAAAVVAGSRDNVVGRGLDGVAVVRAVLAAADPEAAARTLLGILRKAGVAAPAVVGRVVGEAETGKPAIVGLDAEVSLTDMVAAAMADLRTHAPISHNMTNTVVQNFAANAALAVGASPIMSALADEAADLAALRGGLVVNMGTLTPQSLEAFVVAIKAYNDCGGVVVFDPVGAGASSYRRAAVRTIVGAGRLTVLKGNEAELLAVDLLTTSSPVEESVPSSQPSNESPPQQQQRGVDSSSTLGVAARFALVRRLATRLDCVVVLTGAVDFVADGAWTRVPTTTTAATAAAPSSSSPSSSPSPVPVVTAVFNGHPVLGRVTGAGCVLGTVISAFAAADAQRHAAAAEKEEEGGVGHVPGRVRAVVSALLLLEIAAEEAVAELRREEKQQEEKGEEERRETWQGDRPGSFVPLFLDKLAELTDRARRGDLAWVARAKVMWFD